MLAILVFCLVAFGHLFRIICSVPVMVGDWNVPQWASIAGVLVPGLLAIQLWKESR